MAQRLLPPMYDIFIRLEAFHCKDFDLSPNTQFHVWVELHIVLEREPLRHEMIVDQIIDSTREELNTDFEVACVLGTECQGFGSEAIFWYAPKSR
jgi:hypothetical protein